MNTMVRETHTSSIPFIAREFDYETNLESVTTSDSINLLMSIAPEFGDGEVQYAFDDETNSVWLKIPGVSSEISIADINPFGTWGADGESNVIAIRALVKPEGGSANKSSKVHSFTNFYTDGNTMIAEEPILLTHGVPVLNVMDRIVTFIERVNLVNDTD